jgi:heme-degrading monooxygenase HmoA
VLARMSTYEIAEDRCLEAAASFRDALDRLDECTGLIDAYFLTAREGGRGIALTLWESAEAMDGGRVHEGRVRGEAAETVEASLVGVDEYDTCVSKHAGESVGSARS